MDSKDALPPRATVGSISSVLLGAAALVGLVVCLHLLWHGLPQRPREINLLGISVFFPLLGPVAMIVGGFSFSKRVSEKRLLHWTGRIGIALGIVATVALILALLALIIWGVLELLKLLVAALKFFDSHR